MNEADLDVLLARASRRIRAQRALRAALLVLAFSVLAASLLILWARFNPQHSWLVELALAAPLAGALLALLVAFFRFTPHLQSVAMIVDQRAHSAEHLLTWFDLRVRDESRLDPLQRAFRDAQRAATLQKASSFNVSRLLPLRFPDWSRAILLAVLLLCCALLVPAQPLAARKAVVSAQAEGADVSFAPGGGSGSALNPRKPTTPAVVIDLSREDLDKLRFLLLGNAPKEAQLQALQETKSKLGNIPLSQLPAELRDILAKMEANTDTQAHPEETPASSVRRAGSSKPSDDVGSQKPNGAVAVVDYNEKAFSAVREQFSDVDALLERYYKGPTSAAKDQE